MKTLVIGVGNDYRGDDAVGLIVARRLRDLNWPHVEVIESDGEFTKLMESWREAESVILIDAVQSGVAPGTIHRVVAHKEQLSPKLSSGSTHAVGVAEAIALSKMLGRLPQYFIVFGVEASHCAWGATLSNECATACEEVLRLVKREIGCPASDQ